MRTNCPDIYFSHKVLKKGRQHDLIKAFNSDKTRNFILTTYFNSSDMKLHLTCLNQVLGENSSENAVGVAFHLENQHS